MNSAEHIIERLGGTRKAAAITGVPPSTVQSWKTAGFIPARRQAEIIAAAKLHGINLTADEMVGSCVGAPSAGAAAPAKRAAT
jgi:hypothetical protein